MKLEEHRALWNKIRDFQIDDPFASIQFSDKLAHKNNWSKEFTRRAIEEYKRFIFLCCISPSGASPSEIVDEVWHLHLTYTHQYWKEFCGKVLGKEIHHFPSKGGTTEKEKHQNWYASTLVLYRKVFNEEPPSDIWPQNNPVQLNTLNPDATDPDYSSPYKKYLFILLFPFLIPLFFGKLHPFRLNGPQFLVFYIFLLVAVFIVLLLAYREKKRIIAGIVDRLYHGDCNIFQLSRFVYGRNKAMQAAIVDLMAKETLAAEPRGKFIFYPSQYKFGSEKENPLIGNLLRNYSIPYELPLKDVVSNYNDDLTYHPQLAALYQESIKKDFYRIAVVLLFALIGGLRLMQGINNNRPVGFLAALLMGGIFILIILVSGLSGKYILQSIFKSKYQQGHLEFPEQPAQVSQFVFLGLASLAGMVLFSNLENTFRYYSSGAGMTGGGSCGSSGCGSSCGSGCGGGCGGCGGGD